MSPHKVPAQMGSATAITMCEAYAKKRGADTADMPDIITQTAIIGGGQTGVPLARALARGRTHLIR